VKSIGFGISQIIWKKSGRKKSKREEEKKDEKDKVEREEKNEKNGEGDLEPAPDHLPAGGGLGAGGFGGG